MFKQDSQERTFKTRLSFKEVGARLQQFATKKNAKVSRLTTEHESNPLGQFDSHSDLEILLDGAVGLGLGNRWGVQVYVDDSGNGCQITLLTMGRGGLKKLGVGLISAGLNAITKEEGEKQFDINSGLKKMAEIEALLTA
jgi:hypothetical protein